MRSKRFRIKSPALAIMSNDGDGDRIPVALPIGAEIEVVGDPFNGENVVDIVWNGRVLTMFTQDVREQGEQLDKSS